MKVNLIKEANYELNDAKCSLVPFDVFLKMASVDENKTQEKENLKSVRLFTTIEDFREGYNKDTFDEGEKVRILPNGQFCLYLKENISDKDADIKDSVEVKKLNKQSVENASTDTKENTDKKS